MQDFSGLHMGEGIFVVIKTKNRPVAGFLLSGSLRLGIIGHLTFNGPLLLPVILCELEHPSRILRG